MNAVRTKECMIGVGYIRYGHGQLGLSPISHIISVRAARARSPLGVLQKKFSAQTVPGPQQALVDARGSQGEKSDAGEPSLNQHDSARSHSIVCLFTL